MNESTKQPIPNEQLEDLVALADMASEPIPVITGNHFTAGQKASQIRTREAYRKLAYELAGDLAQEVLDLRAQIKEVSVTNFAQNVIDEIVYVVPNPDPSPEA
jgi:FMN-dependent NADH-azoreductase